MVPPLAGYGSNKIRAWCNGSIRVSKTFDLGSNPSARANFLMWKFENKNVKMTLGLFCFNHFQIFKFANFQIKQSEQNIKLLQWVLQRINGESNLA